MNIITLSNGKKVANFSSPHSFTFEDGSVLPAVSNEEAERLKVTFIETEVGNGDIELSFDLSRDVIKAMNMWQKAYEQGFVKVVFCPLPMITAMKGSYLRNWLKEGPFRAIRMVDRINKTVSINKQCL